MKIRPQSCTCITEAQGSGGVRNDEKIKIKCFKVQYSSRGLEGGKGAHEVCRVEVGDPFIISHCLTSDDT
jgi:hypothetical protein